MTVTDMSLLCVHAHPDDEAWWTGGPLAGFADAGTPRLLGYADARVPESAPGAPRFCDAPLGESVGRLAGQLRDFRPDAVITYDAYGGYGHPDHVHAHRVTLAAVEAAGYARLCPEAGGPWRPRALYLVTVPRSAVLALWPQVFGGRPEPGQPLPGVPDEEITTTVDVRRWHERTGAAFAARESEAERRAGPAAFAALPEDARQRPLDTEWFIRGGHADDPLA